jgi:hypothetical protein
MLLGAIVQPVIREAPRRFMSITSYLRGSGGGGYVLKFRDPSFHLTLPAGHHFLFLIFFELRSVPYI